MGIIYQSVPVGAIQTLEESKRGFYIAKSLETPKKVQDILFSNETSAFVRGLVKSYDIDINLSPKIALAILFIAIGEKTLAQLPAILSTELKLPNDKAQKMAVEIEKDVFGPVRGELEEFLRQQSNPPRKVPSSAGTTGIRNVLNLKELPARKPQTALPTTPHPRPLPEQERGATKPQASKFPLPPKRSSPLPPFDTAQGKPPQPPIRFT